MRKLHEKYGLLDKNNSIPDSLDDVRLRAIAKSDYLDDFSNMSFLDRRILVKLAQLICRWPKPHEVSKIMATRAKMERTHHVDARDRGAKSKSSFDYKVITCRFRLLNDTISKIIGKNGINLIEFSEMNDFAYAWIEQISDGSKSNEYILKVHAAMHVGNDEDLKLWIDVFLTTNPNVEIIGDVSVSTERSTGREIRNHKDVTLFGLNSV
jgi:hypothetical protein